MILTRICKLFIHFVRNGSEPRLFMLRLHTSTINMPVTETLVEFLERKRVKDAGRHTHTTMGSSASENGKYFIGEDELPVFYELYNDYVETERKNIWLIEAPTHIGPMRVDLDFTYDGEITKNQHSIEQITKFSKKYMEYLRSFVEIPSAIDVYVMEKKRPTVKKGGVKAGGVHILVPTVRSTKYVEKAIRDILLTQMEECFGDLPLKIKEWDKVYDKAIANRSCGWTMYGSRKPDGGLPYLVSHVLHFEGEDVTVENKSFDAEADVLSLFCTRVLDEKLETPLTPKAKEIFGELPENAENVRISGGAAIKPTRGRPSERKLSGSRDSSPNAGMILRPLTEEERSYYHEHLMNLSPHRADDYHDWMLVGQCLKNIHPDLYDEFEEFSRQNLKFDLRGCMKQWNSFNFRNEGQKVQIGTLLYWSRLDNPDRYKEIQDRNILRKIDASIAGTEYDVASVVYAKYADVYKCVSFSKNVWYKFMGHVWHELDRGVQLQQELSTEIWRAYKNRASFYAKQLMEIDMCNSKQQPCGCAWCECQQKEDAFNKICTKLKTTKYKENVMKECKELFLDELFVKKVDEDRFLMACNNGVFDMKTMQFRDGKQEDYLSFSTNLDIDPEMNYTEYPAWSEVDEFISRVLPVDEVRKYFLSHLAICLSGSACQLFHILTGSGSNGKSMLMNLVETALGDYACKVPISMITQGRNKSSAASPEIVRLKGRRFVTMQEPDEAVPINTGLMKEITSSEKILARDLFAGSKQMTEFELQCKFQLACNEKPKVNSNDGGTWRRLIVINFISKFIMNPSGPNQYKLDSSIEHKVKSDAWGKAFLAYLIHTYKENGGKAIAPPPVVLEYTNDYREENDAITKFIGECTRPVVEGELVVGIRKEHLTDQFKQWWEANRGTRDWKIAEMLKTVETAYGKYQRGGWKSFQLQQDEE
jgi:P4 family phage/plasmid primase-like protien